LEPSEEDYQVKLTNRLWESEYNISISKEHLVDSLWMPIAHKVPMVVSVDGLLPVLEKLIALIQQVFSANSNQEGAKIIKEVAQMVKQIIVALRDELDSDQEIIRELAENVKQMIIAFKAQDYQKVQTRGNALILQLLQLKKQVQSKENR